MNDQPYEPRRLYRSDNAMIFGVCGGIAEHFDLAPWGVRLMWAVLTLPFFPFMIAAYFILALVLRRRPVDMEAAASGFYPGRAPGSRVELLGRIQERFDALDRRLQRMESVVTSPGFDLEEEYRDLK